MNHNNDPHALTIAERNTIQALKMVVGDDAIEAVLSRFRALRTAYDILIPPETNKGDPRKAHEVLQKDRPDLLRAWAGEVRKPTSEEIKAGDGTNKIVVLGWHQFSAAFHAGKASLAELAQQIETVNGLLTKYAPIAAKVEPLRIVPLSLALTAAADAERAAADARALAGELSSRLEAVERALRNAPSPR